MKTSLTALVTTLILLVRASALPAQDLGPHFTKITDGIYVRAEKPADANAAIILTQEGVVMGDD